MGDTQVIWDDGVNGNVSHVAENGLTPDEVDDVLLDRSLTIRKSSRSGLPCRFGWTSTGKYIMVVWSVVERDPPIVAPVTAYEVPPPARQRK